MVQEIWEVARETYYDIEDTIETFEIKGILHGLCQGDSFATQYFSLLTCYWQQLDMFETTKWDCLMDAIKYKKIVKKKQTHKFLLGLKKNLVEVRGRMLGTNPLPNI